MKQHNWFLQIFSVVLIIAMITSAIPAQGQQPPEPGQQPVGSASGAGRPQTASHISTVRDVARISYPGMQTTEETAVQSRALLLAEPQHFDREGIYLWRGPEGTWSIRYSGGERHALSGTISGATQLTDVETRGKALRADLTGEGSLILDGFVETGGDTVEFRAAGDYVYFDLLVDGERNPSRIYIGLHGANPAHIPFRLENRPVIVPVSPHKSTPLGLTYLDRSEAMPSATGSGGQSTRIGTLAGEDLSLQGELPPGTPRDSIEKIQIAQEQGKITEIEALWLKFTALFSPSALPTEYKFSVQELQLLGLRAAEVGAFSYVQRKCGTPTWREILTSYDRLPADLQSAVDERLGSSRI